MIKSIKKFFENQNNAIVCKNIISAFVIKGGGLVVSLLSAPAFIKYFNNDAILGVWYTMLSVLIWFLNFDLGIGNGVRNNLVKAFANKDFSAAKKIISSGLFSSGLVTIVLLFIGVISISFINLSWLFNIPNNIISEKTLFQSVVFVFIAIMLRFWLTTISSVFYAIQKSAINNFLGLCISVMQLLFVSLVRIEDPQKALIALSVSYVFTSNLPILIAGILIFATSLKKCAPSIRCIEKEYVKKVMGIGAIFFICQILYMLIMNTNEFLITKLFSPQNTTEYTFYYKINSIVGMVVSLSMTPVWSVITKTMEEKNYDWVAKFYKKIKLFGVFIIAFQFLILPFYQSIMDVWLGKGTLNVDLKTTIAFACFGSVFVYSSMLSTIVCGMARMKLQAICYFIGVVFKFVFIFSFADFFDHWSIVVWSNFLILAPYCIAQQIDLDIYIKKLKDNL